MENAQLIGLSRQVALRRELDVVAHNIANLETGGFRRQAMVFQEFIMPTAEFNTERRIDEDLSYVEDAATYIDFSPGMMKPSNNPLDVAIKGPGWFAVQTPDGERYTRSGAFSINQAGEMVTVEGFQVQGAAGPIVVPNDAAEITIGSDGTISAGEEEIGQLRLVEFDDPNVLKADGTTVFEADAPPIAAAQSGIVQGMVEASNVNGVSEVTRMIEVTRSYVSVAKMLNDMNQLREDSINALGSTPQS